MLAGLSGDQPVDLGTHPHTSFHPQHRRRTQGEITYLGSRQGSTEDVRRDRRRRQEQRSSPYGLSRYGVAIINLDNPLVCPF